ncbi:NAD(P)H-flavin reductase [Paludibacterium denitrificans]|nr:FAD-binding oxidoreductase [Paludibacterium denitrificans]
MSSYDSNFYELEVLDKEFLNNSVVRLRMVSPQKRGMEYQAGQFLNIELADGDVRSYSMANVWANDGVIELHIRLHKHGKFSELLRTEIEPGSRLKVHGPYGNCTRVNPASTSSKILMLATGTGLAPLKALLEQILEAGSKNPVWLYWGGRGSSDLYFSKQMRDLENAFGKFHYIPVLSNPEPAWSGEVGYIQQVAARDHPSLNDDYVYACGAPAMVNAARVILTKTCNLPDQAFFADAFGQLVTGSVTPNQLVKVSMHGPNGQSTQLNLPEGSSLMEALRIGGHIKGICGGHASCGTCRVNINPKWVEKLKPVSHAEKRLLTTLDEFRSGDRLACQLIVTKTLMGLDFTIPDHLW